MIEILMTLLAALSAVVALLFGSRQRQKQRADQAETESAQKDEVIENVKKRQEIERSVNADSGGSAERLRKDWSRD